MSTNRPTYLHLAVLLAATALSGCDGGGMDHAEDPEPPVVAGQATITIHTGEDRSPISPYIYGSNQDRTSTDRWTVRRLGGNRLTGYNWENNFSNAGNDFQHYNDLFLVSNAGIPGSEADEPGRVATFFHDQSIRQQAASVITLQMAGYVSKDGNGPVSAAEAAPSARWVQVEPRKNAPFETTPNRNDDAVYMDEFVHFLVQRYGDARAPDGIRWYSLDNEPALWFNTHPRIHAEQVGAAELVQRTIDLASAVKDVDPNCAILGPALYGYAAYTSLQGAPDWNQVSQGRALFIDYYLDQMRQAEQSAGTRLLDVLDVHWYPEARGDNRITDAAATTPADVTARLQAPRTLWDPTYTENSWIADCCSGDLPILPRLQQSIDTYYPGTRLAITEYNYGGGATISGGLAQADVLGAFGSQGVYLATLWGIGADDNYTSAAYILYRNYDGQAGAYGTTSVRAATDDRVNTSVYAAIEDEDTATLHVILINKNQSGAMEMRFEIESATTYSTGAVWSFNAGNASIRKTGEIDGITGNTFSYVLPALSAAHLILQ
jgi:mannan endo-1,4-beta-mannosidase